MLTHPTLDQLRALKLDGMADAFVELQSQDNARDLSHARAGNGIVSESRRLGDGPNSRCLRAPADPEQSFRLKASSRFD
jgi:hypothetical protein